MGNYGDHKRDGLIAGAVLGLIVGYASFEKFHDPRLGAGIGVGTFLLVVLGAVLPDIDHPSSIPRRGAVKVVAGGGILALFYAAWTNWRVILDAITRWVSGLIPTIPVEVMAIGIVLLLALAVLAFAPSAVDTITGPHRGWTHSVAAMGLLMAVLGGVIWTKTASFGLTGQVRLFIAGGVPLFLFSGVLVHLARDGEIL